MSLKKAMGNTIRNGYGRQPSEAIAEGTAQPQSPMRRNRGAQGTMAVKGQQWKLASRRFWRSLAEGRGRYRTVRALMATRPDDATSGSCRQQRRLRSRRQRAKRQATRGSKDALADESLRHASYLCFGSLVLCHRPDLKVADG